MQELQASMLQKDFSFRRTFLVFNVSRIMMEMIKRIAYFRTPAEH